MIFWDQHIWWLKKLGCWEFRDEWRWIGTGNVDYAFGVWMRSEREKKKIQKLPKSKSLICKLNLQHERLSCFGKKTLLLNSTLLICVALGVRLGLSHQSIDESPVFSTYIWDDPGQLIYPSPLVKWNVSTNLIQSLWDIKIIFTGKVI